MEKYNSFENYAKAFFKETEYMGTITQEQIDDYEKAESKEIMNLLLDKKIKEYDRTTTEQAKRNYSDKDLPNEERKKVRPVPGKFSPDKEHEIRKGTKNNGQYES